MFKKKQSTRKRMPGETEVEFGGRGKNLRIKKIIKSTSKPQPKKLVKRYYV